MTENLDPQGRGQAHDGPERERLLIEDVLLLLFRPDSGTIAGENVLFYILGAAALGDLTLEKRVELLQRNALSTRVQAAGKWEPEDPLLSKAFEFIEQKPRGVQTVLAAVGPALREPVLNRLVERGDLNRTKGKMLGIFPSTKLSLGSERRAELMRQVRAALIDGETPTERIGACIALISASGTLPQFHKDIPWSGDVYTRGKVFERGDWGASAAAEAVARTMAAVIMNSAIASAHAATTGTRD